MLIIKFGCYYVSSYKPPFPMAILPRLHFFPPPPRPKIRAPILIPSPFLSSSRLISSSMSQPHGHPAAAKKPEDLLVQYVVLRRDLIDSWPTGSVVAQGCHAAVAAVWENRDDPDTIQYCSPENIDSMHKVTVEVKGETQILNLAEKLRGGGIVHKVWVEQPENVATAVATKPYPKSVVASYFKKLKLCK